MYNKFKEYDSFNLSGINKEMLDDWTRQGLFGQSIKEREGSPSFVFYEGPPSANGMPGIHHVMARTIKDIFCRYKTMKGFHVKRKAGWDTHGLPVELGVEKESGYHQRGYRQENKRGRLQRRLSFGSDEIHPRMGDAHRPYGILGGHERSVYHIRQPIYRKCMVASPPAIRQGISLQGLYHTAVFAGGRHRT